MYINIKSPLPQHVRMTARVLVLALHCLVFSVFIFAARGDKFCALGQVSNTSVRLDTAQWNPVHDQLLASLTPASECQEIDCGPNRRPLFKNVQGEREEYTCVCAPGFYMKPETTSCAPCGPGRICIGTDDGRFRCPAHACSPARMPLRARSARSDDALTRFWHILRNSGGFCQILPDSDRFCQILADPPRLSQISQILPDSCTLFQIIHPLPSSPKLSQTLPNAPRPFQTQTRFPFMLLQVLFAVISLFYVRVCVKYVFR